MLRAASVVYVGLGYFLLLLAPTLLGTPISCFGLIAAGATSPELPC